MEGRRRSAQAYKRGTACGELVLLCPAADPGKSSQKDAYRTEPTAFELGADICLYAVDKQNLRYKGQTYLVKPTGQATSTLHVARLEVGENWNPEPAGWWRIDAILRNVSKMAVSVAQVVPTSGKLNGYNVAEPDRDDRIPATPEQRQEIQRFVTAGGTLVIDAAGGSPQFADAAEKELAAMYGGTPPTSAGSSSPATAASDPQGRHDRRRGLPPLHAPPGHRKLDARVRGIKRGRLAVFYSREDPYRRHGRPTRGRHHRLHPRDRHRHHEHPPLRRRGQNDRPRWAAGLGRYCCLGWRPNRRARRDAFGGAPPTQRI